MFLSNENRYKKTKTSSEVSSSERQYMAKEYCTSDYEGKLMVTISTKCFVENVFWIIRAIHLADNVDVDIL